MEALRKDVKENRDAYQYERAARFGVSARGIGKALKRLGITYKKSFQYPKMSAAAREQFQKKIQSHQEPQRPIIYIDESGFAHDLPAFQSLSKLQGLA